MTNYISEKYKKALEQINIEITKQQEKLDSFDEYTEEYKSHLKERIKLEKDKLSLLLRNIDNIMEQKDIQ